MDRSTPGSRSAENRAMLRLLASAGAVPRIRQGAAEGSVAAVEVAASAALPA